MTPSLPCCDTAPPLSRNRLFSRVFRERRSSAVTKAKAKGSANPSPTPRPTLTALPFEVDDDVVLVDVGGAVVDELEDVELGIWKDRIWIWPIGRVYVLVELEQPLEPSLNGRQ